LSNEMSRIIATMSFLFILSSETSMHFCCSSASRFSFSGFNPEFASILSAENMIGTKET
jgi:hypothetical protein